MGAIAEAAEKALLAVEERLGVLGVLAADASSSDTREDVWFWLNEAKGRLFFVELKNADGTPFNSDDRGFAWALACDKELTNEQVAEWRVAYEATRKAELEEEAG